MTFLISTALVIGAIIFLIAGVIMSSTGAYAVAAGLSAVAVILLYRRVKQTQEHSFVTNAPEQSLPNWSTRLNKESSEDEEPEESDVGQEVVIPNYDQLVAAEVLPSLETLSVEDLKAVIIREKSGRGRQAIIHRAETLIDLTLGPSEVNLRTDAEPTPVAAGRKRRTSRSAEKIKEESGPEGPDMSI